MSRKKSIKFALGGRRHTLRYADLKTNYGDCDHLKREIRISRNEDEFEELDVVLHELLHGLDPKWREWWVDRSATELAHALWLLGYRKSGEDAEIS